MSWVFTLFILLLCVQIYDTADDLETAAITVYRNPKFIGYLNQDFSSRFKNEPFFSSFGNSDRENLKDEFFNQSQNHNMFTPPDHDNQEEGEDQGDTDGDEDDSGADDGEDGSEEESDDNENYEEEDYDDNGNYEEEENEVPKGRYTYPGETKRPNPPGSPFHVHFDGSPDFHHPSREIAPSSRPPKRGRGPYGHPRHDFDRYGHGGDEENAVEEEVSKYGKRLHNRVPGGHHLNDPAESHHHTGSGHHHLEEEEHPEEHRKPLLHHQKETRHPISEHEEHSSHEDVPVGDEEVKEMKKGTREYLKHHKLPPHHESYDFQPGKERSSGSIVRHKQPKKYFLYRINPVYKRYRIVPFKVKKKILLLKPKLIPIHRRSSTINEVVDDSSYVLSSELDSQYQTKIT